MSTRELETTRELEIARTELEKLRNERSWERYVIVGDDSGHQYCIPLNRREEWYKWLEAPEGSVSDEVPSYAMRIDGRFSFTDPQITY